MRIVFDTGVLISACLYPERLPALVYLKALRYFSVLSSQATLTELRTVLSRPKFDLWRAAQERGEWFTHYASRTETITVLETITDCTDPKDNIFLELAVSAGAAVIVSSDPHLLCMHPCRGTQILSIQAFKSEHLDPLQ